MTALLSDPICRGRLIACAGPPPWAARAVGQAFSLRRASARFETDQQPQAEEFIRLRVLQALNREARGIRRVSKRPFESRPAGKITCPTKAPKPSGQALSPATASISQLAGETAGPTKTASHFRSFSVVDLSGCPRGGV
jgi:hypothetical protein